MLTSIEALRVRTMTPDVLTTCVLAAGVMLLTWGLKSRGAAKQLAGLRLSLGAVVDLVCIRVRHKHVKVRSEYYWRTRNEMPRCLRWIIDKLLRVDSRNARVDNPTKPSDAVRVQSVALRSHKLLVDLDEHELACFRSRLEVLDQAGAADKVMFAASDLLCHSYVYSDEPCKIVVRYRGHSNPKKKIPAKNYLVRYELADGEVAQFPPYGVRELQKKGFGVKKIKTAVTQGSMQVDVTNLAQTCAGPRYNFYADCDEGSVTKNFIEIGQETLVTYAGSGKEGEKILLPSN